MLIAQISDTHVKTPGRLAYRRVDTAGALAACVASLLERRPAPDLVLVTGDVADFGQAAEYEQARALLAPLPMPVHVLPGNHDRADAMRAAWPDQDWALDSGPLHSVRDQGPVRIVCLDSTVAGQSGGRLDAEALDWLDATLARAPDQPTIVALHHPPFLTGIAHMDAMGLEGREGFAAVVAKYPAIIRILAGHIHRPVQALVGGRLAMTAPSPAHQVALDLTPDGPSRFILEPPGYLLHHVLPDRTIVTHQVVIGDWGDAHPFFAEGALID
ncbi:MAG: phosphodiesterase [Telmatospirillum sp.]|nr:phosphodiesterase [Telmatospirillum sp.]